MKQARLVFLATLWHTLLSPTARAAEPLHRDWQTHPAVVEIETPHDVYALGDVHGDCDRMLKLLATAGVIAPAPDGAAPDALRWTAKHATLICTGDVIDKYTQSYRALQSLRALQAAADKAGGRVIVTLGNHEAEFLAGDGANAKAVEFEKDLEAHGLRPADVATGRDADGLGAWLRTLPVAAKVNRWFFCHAGNTAGLTLADLRKTIEREVDAGGFGAPILSHPNSILEARMRPRPWWDAAANVELKDKKPRPDDDAAAGEQRLRANLAALGCDHLVFGHQPTKLKFADGSTRAEGEIATRFNGLVFLIDTGMSRGVASNRPALLKIHVGDHHDAATVVDDDGKAAEIWSTR